MFKIWRTIIEAMRNARLKREAIEWTDIRKIRFWNNNIDPIFTCDDTPEKS